MICRVFEINSQSFQLKRLFNSIEINLKLKVFIIGQNLISKAMVQLFQTKFTQIFLNHEKMSLNSMLFKIEL